jgi:uncharacterized protein
MLIRDPIHGDIKVENGGFSKLFRAILDTRAFQRLRAIRQNALANLVFPGAEHSRFAHAVGCHHVANLMHSSACRNGGISATHEELEETILAALLHDLGHGPFSHTLEMVVERAGHSFSHEAMTERLISEDSSEIAVLLENYRSGLAKRLVPFINSERRAGERRWQWSIVSSQLDADRVDYLLRDTYNLGVRYGFDSERLIDSLTVHDGQLAVQERALGEVDSFLLTLDRMYEVAYFHGTVRAASVLLASAIMRAYRLGLDSARDRDRLFPARGDRGNSLWALLSIGERVALDDYVALTDHIIWAHLESWRNESDATLRDLSSRLFSRELLKSVDIVKELSYGQANRLLTQAKTIFERQYPHLKTDLYIEFDEPERVSYKVSSVSRNREPIYILTKTGLKAIEEFEARVARLVADRMYFPRLILHPGIRTAVSEVLAAL